MMKKSNLFLIFLFTGAILAAGCTAPVLPGVPAPGTTPQTSPSIVVPTAIEESPPNGTSWPPAPPQSAVTMVATTRIAADNPFLEYLNIRKRTFIDPLPNCLMEDAFPFIKNGTRYGIKQVEPELFAISEEEYRSFLRRYTRGDGGNTKIETVSACQGSVTADPTWNFVEIRVVLDPTNFNPANYTVTRNVWADGKIVAQFPTTRQIVIGEKVILTDYIPVRNDEIDLINTVAVAYTRL